MSVSVTHLEPEITLGERLSVAKMPAHWLMARLGKRVLRPGGIETTRWLLENGRVDAADDVVELAPGLGVTARAILARGPQSYAGIERDEAARRITERALQREAHQQARAVRGDAAAIPIGDGAATVVVGEAMLSMQLPEKKRAIMQEVRRVLRPGGRYLIHELAVEPEHIDRLLFERIQRDLSTVIHVGVRIGTPSDWKTWLSMTGFDVERATTAPMRLLEPDRLVRDEGIAGALRFGFNVVRTPGAAARLAAVRRVFRAHQDHLCAIAIVARRRANERS